MEGVLPKVRCQIIADFNGKDAAKWKMFTVCHLSKMECKKIAIYCVMQLMDAGKSVIVGDVKELLCKNYDRRLQICIWA